MVCRTAVNTTKYQGSNLTRALWHVVRFWQVHYDKFTCTCSKAKYTCRKFVLLRTSGNYYESFVERTVVFTLTYVACHFSRAKRRNMYQYLRQLAVLFTVLYSYSITGRRIANFYFYYLTFLLVVFTTGPRMRLPFWCTVKWTVVYLWQL